MKKNDFKANFSSELLAPAGSLEKLNVSILYGADAVYLGAQNFGLRAAAENFSESELRRGVKFAHDRGRKVYLVLNSFPFDSDLDQLPSFLKRIEDIKIDAVIVSDLGMASVVRECSSLEIHTSTQASCLNVEAAKVWKSVGATRVVLGREASLKDAVLIKEKTGLEIEMFVHGSLCMAYSGHCVISNFTQGRDSNRGGCAHSCRFEYSMDNHQSSHFMSSKDLNALAVLWDMKEARIDSLKVEGRMKGPLYAAVTTKVYALALNFLKQSPTKHEYLDYIKDLAAELTHIPHRDYTEGAFWGIPAEESIYQKRDTEGPEYPLSAWVREVKEGSYIALEVRKTFETGDELEFIPFDGANIKFKVEEMKDISGATISKTKPSTMIKIPWLAGVQPWNVVRRAVS
jgi:putative protease